MPLSKASLAFEVKGEYSGEFTSRAGSIKPVKDRLTPKPPEVVPLSSVKTFCLALTTAPLSKFIEPSSPWPEDLDNCFVVEGGNPEKLILESKFIIAFNSTAIFEGLAAKKKVVIPYFKNDYNKELKEFTIDTSNSNNILHAENEIHLEELLNDLCKDDEKLKYIDSERDNELLEENIGNKDGNSSRRLTKVIESLV